MKKEKLIIQEKGREVPCFFYKYSVVQSTNDFAKKMIKDESHFAVLAYKQSKGRGRYDRQFISKRNRGIYLTIVFRTDENIKKVSQYSMYAAIAVKHVLEKHGSGKIDFKWPNDLQLNGLKCCGILCESVMRNSDRYAVIGIGVNLFYKQQELGELKNKATNAVSIETKKKKEKIIEIAKNIIEEFFELFEKPHKSIYDEYILNCNVLNKYVEHKNRMGKVISVNEDLSIKIDFGDEIADINYGEIIVQHEKNKNVTGKE